jgi:hypothetical protein
MYRKIDLKLSCFLLIFTIGLVMFITAKVPFDIGDDVQRISAARSASWGSLLGDSFDLSVDTENLLGDHCVTRGFAGRPMQQIALKSLLFLFGPNPMFFYLFKSMFFAGLVILVYFVVLELTKSRIFSFCAAVFVLVNPVTQFHVVWISDFGIVVSALTLGAVLVLMKKKWSILKLIILLVIAFLAMRTKLSGIIILIIAADFYILSAKSRFSPEKRFLFVFVFTTLCALAAGFITPSFSPTLVRDLVLLNRTSGYEIEKTLTLFSIEAQLPMSLLRNFGFFLSWAILVAAISYVIREKPPRNIGFLAIVLWLYQIILFSGFTRNEPRYLTDMVVPATIVSAYLMDFLIRVLKKPLKYIAVLWLVVGYIFIVSNNFTHLIFFARWQTNFTYSFDKLSRIIYGDYHGKKAEDIFVLSDFVMSPKLQSIIVFAQFSIWDKGPKIDENVIQKAKESNGAAYLVFSGDHESEIKNKMELIGTVDTANEIPFDSFMKLFRKKTRPVMSVYKYVG